MIRVFGVCCVVVVEGVSRIIRVLRVICVVVVDIELLWLLGFFLGLFVL